MARPGRGGGDDSIADHPQNHFLRPKNLGEEKMGEVAVGEGTITASTTIGGLREVGDGDTYQECNQDVPCAHPRFFFHATLLGGCDRYPMYIIHLN